MGCSCSAAAVAATTGNNTESTVTTVSPRRQSAEAYRKLRHLHGHRRSSSNQYETLSDTLLAGLPVTLDSEAMASLTAEERIELALRRSATPQIVPSDGFDAMATWGGSP